MRTFSNDSVCIKKPLTNTNIGDTTLQTGLEFFKLKETILACFPPGGMDLVPEKRIHCAEWGLILLNVDPFGA
jgi:hypothetical protein